MTVKAAVLLEAGEPLAIERLTLGPCGDHDVVIRVRATSLCHTDLEAVRGDLGSPLRSCRVTRRRAWWNGSAKPCSA
jgi:S-(hydroxymethyl)glutathione dehydrogenase / alcohol dehydrogenase